VLGSLINGLFTGPTPAAPTSAPRTAQRPVAQPPAVGAVPAATPIDAPATFADFSAAASTPTAAAPASAAIAGAGVATTVPGLSVTPAAAVIGNLPMPTEILSEDQARAYALAAQKALRAAALLERIGPPSGGPAALPAERTGSPATPVAKPEAA